MVKDLGEEETFSFELVKWPHVITWSEGHLTLRVCSSYHKPPPCQVWWIWVLQKRRYFISILSRNLMWPRGHRVMWNYGWVLFIISHHPHPKLLATAVVQGKIFHFYFVTWPHVIKGLESQVTLKVILSCHKWLPCKASWSKAFWKRRYKLSICHVSSHDHGGQMTSWVNSADYKSPPC